MSRALAGVISLTPFDLATRYQRKAIPDDDVRHSIGVTFVTGW